MITYFSLTSSQCGPPCGPPCQKHLFFSILSIQVFYADSWYSWTHHFIFSTEINVKMYFLSNHTDTTWSLYHMLKEALAFRKIRWCWWTFLDVRILVASFECWCPTLMQKLSLYYIVDVGDQNGQNRHHHLKVVANTFRHQDPSQTSVTNIDESKNILTILLLTVLRNCRSVWVSLLILSILFISSFGSISLSSFLHIKQFIFGKLRGFSQK